MPDLQWTPTEILESLLTDAIAQVRQGQTPNVLAKAIMLAIRTEVARAQAEVLKGLAIAMREEGK